MPAIDRRTVLEWLAAAPLAAGIAWTDAEATVAFGRAQAARGGGRAGAAFTPAFFSPHEYETVRLLVDLIIPRDERSGSATDAGVPEFMDFIMLDEPKQPHATGRQTAMRGGLAWLDLECQRRFDRTFVASSDAERTALLDDIAMPDPEPDSVEASDARADDVPTLPVLSHGRAFFATFRDLTATGFWTTKAGMDDLQYVGNRVVTTWNGCPPEALARLGVTYPPDPPA